MMSQKDNKKITVYRHFINDGIEMIDDAICIMFFFKYLFALTLIGNILINHLSTTKFYLKKILCNVYLYS